MKLSDIPGRAQKRLAGWQNQQRIQKLAHQVAAHAQPQPNTRPVVFFNASTRITGLSQNAAFSLLTSWGLRLGGVRVVHFVCEQGMSRCVLGLNRADYTQSPPCQACMTQSHRLFSGAEVYPFSYREDPHLAARLQALSMDELGSFEYSAPMPASSPLPLGKLVLPSIRWTLRRHHLPDDEPTRFLMRAYILSAYQIAGAFYTLLQQAQPQAVVIFNGIMYPEATARWVTRQLGVRSVAHEVGFRAFSAFFTKGEPTAYPIEIPDDFQLTPQQAARLDEYLERRFQGKFTMAGIRFWPELRGLDQAFLDRAAQFRQIIPVFTNVIYDSSQVHANTVFPHMFAWLDLVREIILAHPETFFVIRAHPDEMRPGTAKQSNESVHDWVIQNGVNQLPNVIFIEPDEFISSYELIQRSKFVLVYNSSIGLEATLLETPVICGGKARYNQYATVFLPTSSADFSSQVESFLTADEIELPAEFLRNARRFLYYQFFRVSLPFDKFLQEGETQGQVYLKSFSWQDLLPGNSPTVRIILDGILNGSSDFYL